MSGEHLDKYNNKFKQITIWQWIGRIVPMVSLAIIFLAYFYFTNQLNLAVTILLGLACVIPIIWWWWAMDTMKWLGHLYTTTLTQHSTILEELKDIRKAIIIDNDSNSNRKR